MAQVRPQQAAVLQRGQHLLQNFLGAPALGLGKILRGPLRVQAGHQFPPHVLVREPQGMARLVPHDAVELAVGHGQGEPLQVHGLLVARDVEDVRPQEAPVAAAVPADANLGVGRGERELDVAELAPGVHVQQNLPLQLRGCRLHEPDRELNATAAPELRREQGQAAGGGDEAGDQAGQVLDGRAVGGVEGDGHVGGGHRHKALLGTREHAGPRW